MMYLKLLPALEFRAKPLDILLYRLLQSLGARGLEFGECLLLWWCEPSVRCFFCSLGRLWW